MVIMRHRQMSEVFNVSVADIVLLNDAKYAIVLYVRNAEAITNQGLTIINPIGAAVNPL